MARKPCSDKQALWVAINQGGVVPCYQCKEPFTLEETATKGAIEREHEHEIALGGPDTKDNWRWSHRECHKRVTYGNGATSAGSSRHRIDKTNRTEKARLALERGEEKAAPLGRPKWPKQTIKSRGFGPGNMKRTISGQVVPRERVE